MQTRGQRRRTMGLSSSSSSLSKGAKIDVDTTVADTRKTSTNGHHPKTTTSYRAEEIQEKEKKKSKIFIRVFFGALLVGVFFGSAWAGHIYIFLLIVGIQVMLFKELVAVRYRAAMEKKTPLFRTLQWSWFVAAMAYAHGDSIVKTLREDRLLDVNDDDQPEKSVILGSFSMFSALFVVSVLTLRPGLYKYQVGQLAWTVVILLIIVGQLKVVAPNIFSGIFWYFFPASCIMVNDIMAYFCGMSFGRRFIKMPFLRLSPNKTWEGFIGAFFFTLLWAYWFSGFLSQYKYFTCSYKQLRPPNQPELFSMEELRPGSTFKQALYWEQQKRENAGLPDILPPDRVFTDEEIVLPESLAKLFHRESLPIRPIQFHGMIIGTFGSLVAPFGGFLMSAIKRAYGIKDFDSLIPGHGGVTDRMDCQLVMILFTFVHYQTFIRHVPLNYERVWDSIQALKDSEQMKIYENLRAFMLNKGLLSSLREGGE